VRSAISILLQRQVAQPPVGVNDATRLDRVLHKGYQAFGEGYEHEVTFLRGKKKTPEASTIWRMRILPIPGPSS